MQLRPRDLEILEFIGEYGTADSFLIGDLFWRATPRSRNVTNRLKKMHDEEGLLKIEKPPVTHGSDPEMVFLTEKGAELVEEHTGSYPRRVTRKRPSPHTLRHRMDVVRVRHAIDEAAKLAALPSPQWIMEQDRRGQEKSPKKQHPNANQILNDTFWIEELNRSVAFRPDMSFQLEVPRPSGNDTKSLLGYLEVDRGSEGLKQWYGEGRGKLWGIDAFLSDTKAWRGHWPEVTDPAIVIFVVCLSTKDEDSSVRLANLMETAKNFKAYQRVRFTTYPLDPQTVLTDDIWRGYGKDDQMQKFRIIAKKS